MRLVYGWYCRFTHVPAARRARWGKWAGNDEDDNDAKATMQHTARLNTYKQLYEQVQHVQHKHVGSVSFHTHILRFVSESKKHHRKQAHFGCHTHTHTRTSTSYAPKKRNSFSLILSDIIVDCVHTRRCRLSAVYWRLLQSWFYVPFFLQLHLLLLLFAMLVPMLQLPVFGAQSVYYIHNRVDSEASKFGW